MQMLPSKEAIKETIEAVPTKTWKIVGGLLAFGLIMRLATSVSKNRD